MQPVSADAEEEVHIETIIIVFATPSRSAALGQEWMQL
jgi:hypothetical protein